MHDLTDGLRACPHKPRGVHGTLATLRPLLAVALLFVGCATPVGVRRTGFEPVFAELSQNVLIDGTPSENTRQIVAALGLQESLRTDPTAAIRRLTDLALSSKERELFGVLAELHYARALGSKRPLGFLAAATFAYFFLLSDELGPPPDPFDAQFRLACDIYNRGLARALLDESGGVDLRNRVFETDVARIEITVSRPGFPWDEEEFQQFLPSDAFQVRGLRERARTSGLGVPLIAIRNANEVQKAASKKGLGRTQRLGATAVLEIGGGLEALRAHRLHANLMLFQAGELSTISLGGHVVPLESDVTAPLAHGLESSKLWALSIQGFLGGKSDFPPGVYPMNPYQVGKIPIVLIHGTASNPAEWAQMVNGLLFDEEVRRHYQFWFAIYDTGTPILYNAALIRGSLEKLVAQFDPTRRDAALSRMVLIGHSQGGLVARLLVSSSGDRFWGVVSKNHFDEQAIPKDVRELVRNCFFFEPLRFVQRVVFISTPHGGSFVASSWIGSLALRLVSLPGDLVTAVSGLTKGAKLPPELLKNIPTSIHNMAPGSNFVKTLATVPISPSVHLHSIVAVSGSGPAESGEDGVVRYSSAHLDQAESELVVRHGHSCQNEPETVLEVRRILREHLEGRKAPKQ